jgi:hypothetical protein
MHRVEDHTLVRLDHDGERVIRAFAREHVHDTEARARAQEGAIQRVILEDEEGFEELLPEASGALHLREGGVFVLAEA